MVPLRANVNFATDPPCAHTGGADADADYVRWLAPTCLGHAARTIGGVTCVEHATVATHAHTMSAVKTALSVRPRCVVTESCGVDALTASSRCAACANTGVPDGTARPAAAPPRAITIASAVSAFPAAVPARVCTAGYDPIVARVGAASSASIVRAGRTALSVALRLECLQCSVFQVNSCWAPNRHRSKPCYFLLLFRLLPSPTLLRMIDWLPV